MMTDCELLEYQIYLPDLTLLLINEDVFETDGKTQLALGQVSIRNYLPHLKMSLPQDGG